MSLTPSDRKARQREANRLFKERHGADYVAKTARHWREKHPAYARQWEKTHPEYRTERARKHNAVLADRPRSLMCEICGDTKCRIVFDHCHRRNVFRGWICNSCNVILGFAKDDPARLRKITAYLERTQKLISAQLTLPGV